jgi:hypothetical protein
VVYVLQGIGVVFIEETAVPRAGALASLRPRMSVPAAVRGALWRAAPALIAVWALAGFYGSLGPKLVHNLAGTTSILLGGVSLFAMAGSGALSVLLLRGHSARTLMRLGAGSLLVGLTVALTAVPQHSVLLFLFGTSIAGLGFGTGFQGALRTVIDLIAAHERAAVLSVLFVVSYLALGMPAIAAGYGLAHQGDIVRTTFEFGATVMTLASLALAGTWVSPVRT